MNSETLVGTMSLPREQKKSQPPLADLAIFGGVIAFLGVSLHFFFAGREAPKAMPLAKPLETPATERAPASQSPAPTTLSTQVLRLPCLANGPQVVSSSARLIQIHSPLCSANAQASATWRASNATSGEEILVFVNHKEKSLSTSYFNLKEGRNELVFVQDLGQGRTARQMVQINRQAD